MCGIAAMIAPGANADAAALRRMSASLRHRGPDDEGMFLAGPVGFSFRRLAIIDLTPAGHQPLISSDGQLALVFNGEIFNYIELRRELISLGHTFRSSSDSEVLLASYRQWGRECLNKFNGMWAFLIYDARTQRVFGARDRFGIKPLYRCQVGSRILFASEIKALRASGYYRAEVNWRRASEYLLYSYHRQADNIDTTSETFFRGIEPVPAGSAFEIDLDGQTRQWRYWSLLESIPAQPKHPVETYLETFDDAVRLRMRSDVPVGASLSGGIDSSAIVCTMAELGGRSGEAQPNIHAFSHVCSEFDESSFIRDTVRKTRATWRPVKMEAIDLWKKLEESLSYQDEPFNSMNILIASEIGRQAAAQGIRVLLNGGGADESIGGYFTNFSNCWLSLIQAGESAKARREIEAFCDVHGGHPGAIYRSTLVRRWRSELRRLAPYRMLASKRQHLRLREGTWFSQEIVNGLPNPGSGPRTGTLEAALQDLIERAPLPYYLRTDDRTFMAHSVELRVPFLDYRLVTLAFALPPDWRMHGPWNKFVLREAMKGRLPERVRTRVSKMGFPVPSREWLKGPLYEPVQDLLASQSTRSRGLYNIDLMRQDLERHRTGEVDASSGLLAVAQLELWMRDLQEPASQMDLPA